MKISQLRQIIKEEIQNILKEVQLDPLNQKLKDKYIENYLEYVISPYDYEGVDPNKIEDHAEKFGYTNTLRTIDQVETSSKPRYSGKDPLATKMPGSDIDNLMMRDPMQHLTKKGKMDKRDIERLKMKIKQNLGLD